MAKQPKVKAKRTKAPRNLSKLFSIIFSIILVAATVIMFICVAALPEFVKPISFKIDSNEAEYTIDEYAEFLLENDYLKTADYKEVTVSDTSVTEARKYGEDDVLYWNSEEMDKESESYKKWKTYSTIGNMSLDDGTLIIVYGNFGVTYHAQKIKETVVVDGQTQEREVESYKLFESFPEKYSGNHGNATAWDYTFDEFADYMVQNGIFPADRSEWATMSTIGTEGYNWIINSIDVMWWDVANLVEGTEPYTYWNELQTDGYIMFAGTVYFVEQNGPFAIHINSKCPLDSDTVLEVFRNFPKNYQKAE